MINVQRAALLIVALATGTTSAFPLAVEDRLHQPYRAALVPGLDEILRLRAPGLLGCALSGAGRAPSEARPAASPGWTPVDSRSTSSRCARGRPQLSYQTLPDRPRISGAMS